MRLARGYKTIDQATAATGIKRSNLDNAERKGTDPRLSTITEIQVGLGVTIAELLDGVSGPGAAAGVPVPGEHAPAQDDPGAPRPRARRADRRGNGSKNPRAK
jgi:transcriptional regulator with XRE-family HTH domain